MRKMSLVLLLSLVLSIFTPLSVVDAATNIKINSITRSGGTSMSSVITFTVTGENLPNLTGGVARPGGGTGYENFVMCSPNASWCAGYKSLTNGITFVSSTSNELVFRSVISTTTNGYTGDVLIQLSPENTDISTYPNASRERGKINISTGTYTKIIQLTSPTNLVGTAGDSQVSLEWTAATGTDLQGYNLYRNGVKINSGTITATSYTVTGLINNTTYEFYVKAVDNTGYESSASNTVTLTPVPDPDTTAPSVPSNVELLAGDQNVKVIWSASTDNIGVAGYNVYRNANKVNPALITALSYTDVGLINGTTYTYQVSAVDTSGNESAKSSPISVKPTDKMTVQLIPNKDSIIVQIANGLAPFDISWDDGSEQVNATSFTIPDLLEDTDYTVTVTDAAGVTITQTINTGHKKAYVPPVFPAPDNIFQSMLDNFGDAGTIAVAVILGAVALGIICILGIYGWRLSKRWLASAR